MKHLFFTLLLLSSTCLLADKTTSSMSDTLTKAIERVENARKDALATLHNMINNVDQARINSPEHNRSISTKIIETYALGVIAKSTASVEIAKAKAMSLINQAIDNMDPKSINTIANAVASVEVAKAKATQNIVNVTRQVEMSKNQTPKELKHGNDTLAIAKNVSAIQIAKSTAQTEVARAVSLVEIARSSMEASFPDGTKVLKEKSLKTLEEIKSKATANISSYLANIEVTKANMLSKIASEVAKVEIAKINTLDINEPTEIKSSTYPKIFINKD